MQDKPAPRKRELLQLASSLHNRKPRPAAQPRLRPIHTQHQFPRASNSKPSPKHQQFSVQRRKPHHSQLDISLPEADKRHKLSLITDNFTPRNFQSVVKALEKRYFTSKADLSPYYVKRAKVREGSVVSRRDGSEDGRRIRVQGRHSNISGREVARQTVVKAVEEPPEQGMSQPQAQTAESDKVPNPYNLSEKELETFGDRFPEKFQKIRILGKGGFSLVWLGIHRKSKKPFAIKQILTKNNHQTHLKQIWFGNFFFEFGGTVRQQFSKHPGTDHLIRMYAYDIRKQDTWIFYELCQTTLGCALYSLRPQIIDGTKKYRMTYRHLYQQFISDPTHLKTLIIQLSRALLLLSQHNIVHSDLKTQNILLLQSQQSTTYKLIDYGSSFLFSNLKQFSMATPEYMAPQILNFILYQNEMKYNPAMLKLIKTYQNQSAIDVWSMGCIVLEIVNGVPLWLSFQSEIVTGQRTWDGKTGLFAVKDRNFQRIIERQVAVVGELDKVIEEKNYSGIRVDKWLKELIIGMLDLNPNTRIKPKEILKRLGQPYEFEKVYWESSQQL